MLANAFVSLVLFLGVTLVCCWGIWVLMVLFFQRFGAGDLVDEDGKTAQLSAILCCKCLLKLLTEYMSCVLLRVTWLPRELKWPFAHVFVLCQCWACAVFFFCS